MEELRSVSRNARVWVVAPEPIADRLVASMGTGATSPEVVTAGVALTRAISGDVVLIAGLAPADLVPLAEQLLEKHIGVAIETSGIHGLRRALGERWKGIECVRLEPAESGAVDRWITRLRDVAASLGAIAVLSPALLVTAILVKRSSPGPMFYSTTVVGRNGAPFLWRKVRTMRIGTADDDLKRREQYRQLVASGSTSGTDTSTKIVDPTRVTPVGRFLRRHSLDELPQLWNVLVGDMALVGPRPCLPYEYELQADWHRKRFRVTPGLTGPWQAYGRSRVSVDEMALIDYCYGRRRGFWLDLRIIAKTFQVVVNGEGGQ